MRFKCKCDGFFLYKSLELYDITPDTIQTDDVNAQYDQFQWFTHVSDMFSATQVRWYDEFHVEFWKSQNKT